MIKFLAWTAVTALSLGQMSYQPDHVHLCKGIVEQNTMRIPVGGMKAMGVTGGLDEAGFNRVLDRIETLYTPIVAKAGGKLVVVRNWTDETVNAYAEQIGTRWEIQMFGGLARHPVITEDAFAVVACHEIGHHIGGAPKVKNIWSRWASNEGQSDYFASLKCLRLYFDQASTTAWMKSNGSNVPKYVVDQCAAVYSSVEQRETCQRSALATYAVSALFQDLRGEVTPPMYDHPDMSNVLDYKDPRGRKTPQDKADEHPGTQCRLDTYFSGALCDKDVSAPLSNSDYKQGTCAAVNGYKVGTRPLCWFIQ